MANINNTLNIPVMDPITRRFADHLDAQKQRGRGRMAEALSRCSVGGFALHELGHGVLAAWVDLNESGQLEGGSQADKAAALVRLLQAVAPEVIPQNPDTRAPTPDTRAPTPGKSFGR